MGALVLPAIIVLPGVLLTFIGWTFFQGYRDRTALLEESVETTAEVLDTRVHEVPSVRKTEYYARIRYTTESGQTIEGETLIDEAEFRRAGAGQRRIPIVYAASAPEEHAGRGVWEQEVQDKKLFAWFLGSWGVLMIFGGVYVGYRLLR